MNKKKKILIALGCLILAAAIGFGIYHFAVKLPEQKKQEELATLFREHYENRVALFEEENKKHSPGEVDVVFLGDSLTEGYDLATFYPQYITVNRGIGGDTTFGLWDRLEVSAYELEPKVVVMLIGANNFDTMFERYEDIVKALRENLPDTHIVLISLTSMGMDWGKNNHKAAFNNVKIKLIAERNGCSFVDMFTPLLNEETNEIYPEYTIDGGHLTDKGYQVFTDTLTPVLEKLLGK